MPVLNTVFREHYQHGHYVTKILSKMRKLLNINFVHVNDVATDWSYALADFLVSTLFPAFPGNPSNVLQQIEEKGIGNGGSSRDAFTIRVSP